MGDHGVSMPWSNLIKPCCLGTTIPPGEQLPWHLPRAVENAQLINRRRLNRVRMGPRGGQPLPGLPAAAKGAFAELLLIRSACIHVSKGLSELLSGEAQKSRRQTMERLET